ARGEVQRALDDVPRPPHPTSAALGRLSHHPAAVRVLAGSAGPAARPLRLSPSRRRQGLGHRPPRAVKLRLLIAVVFLVVACAHTAPPRGLYIDDGGPVAGVPVLLVHGNGASSTQWRAQLEHLRRSRRAMAFDLRGMGRSAPPAGGDYSLAAM